MLAEIVVNLPDLGKTITIPNWIWWCTACLIGLWILIRLVQHAVRMSEERDEQERERDRQYKIAELGDLYPLYRALRNAEGDATRLFLIEQAVSKMSGVSILSVYAMNLLKFCMYDKGSWELALLKLKGHIQVRMPEGE